MDAFGRASRRQDGYRHSPHCGGQPGEVVVHAGGHHRSVPGVRRLPRSGADAGDRHRPGSNSGKYAVRHDPPPYYTSLKGCSTFDVPYTRLAADLSSRKLPSFSFVTPNLISDMHDGTVKQGDTWLSTNLPVILASPAYTSGSLAVMITWDEGEGGTSNNCATNTTDVGCHVATIVVSPTTKGGTKSGTLFNHWSLLRTTEDILKLPELGRASTANSMVSAFNL
jgi:hypothetical protein